MFPDVSFYYTRLQVLNPEESIMHAYTHTYVYNPEYLLKNGPLLEKSHVGNP